MTKSKNNTELKPPEELEKLAVATTELEEKEGAATNTDSSNKWLEPEFVNSITPLEELEKEIDDFYPAERPATDNEETKTKPAKKTYQELLLEELKQLAAVIPLPKETEGRKLVDDGDGQPELKKLKPAPDGQKLLWNNNSNPLPESSTVCSLGINTKYTPLTENKSKTQMPPTTTSLAPNPSLRIGATFTIPEPNALIYVGESELKNKIRKDLRKHGNKASDHKKAMETLFKYRTPNNDNPFHIALKLCASSTIKAMLMDRNLRPDDCDFAKNVKLLFNQQNNQGETPLHCFVKRMIGNDNMGNLAIDAEIFATLGERIIAGIDIQDNEGVTVRSLIALANQEDICNAHRGDTLYPINLRYLNQLATTFPQIQNVAAQTHLSSTSPRGPFGGVTTLSSTQEREGR